MLVGIPKLLLRLFKLNNQPAALAVVGRYQCQNQGQAEDYKECRDKDGGILFPEGWRVVDDKRIFWDKGEREVKVFYHCLIDTVNIRAVNHSIKTFRVSAGKNLHCDLSCQFAG